MEKNIPRILIAAPSSGSGKTLITCGLLNQLAKRGISPTAFKCGPDYIDPMFHRLVQKIHSDNLDLFFESPQGIREIMGKGNSDFALLEGVMGIFDGMSPKSDAGSCYEISKETKTPIILVVDASGSGRTIISVVTGILSDDKEGLIKGIIFNRMSREFYGKLCPILEEALRKKGFDAKVLGAVPKCPEAAIDSRHLGLMLPHEIADLDKRIAAFGQVLDENIDIEGIIGIAGAVDPLIYVDSAKARSPERNLTLAVARDRAFCFYYEKNLELFREKGVRIQFFSPLNDQKLPDDIRGVLLGGGYPELYLEKLSENRSMLSSIRDRISCGIPCLAECGGFMYLHERIFDKENVPFEMAGVVKGECRYSGHLVRFGYLELEELGIRGHEFHYFESTSSGTDLTAHKPDGTGRRRCMISSDRCLLGFPHLYYGSNEAFVDSFIDKMEAYSHEKQL